MALTKMEKANKSEVENSIGETVYTVYGPCTVISLDVKSKQVILDEDGEEFAVKLSEYHSFLQ